MTSHHQPRKINNKIVIALWCIAISSVLFLFLHTYLTTQTPPELQDMSRTSQHNSQALKRTTLGLTADEFKNNFNKIAKENKINMEINSLNIQKGLLQNTFQFMLTDDITLIGNVDGPNDELQKITVLNTGTEASQPGSAIHSVILVVIRALNPALSITEQATLHTELGLSTSKTNGDTEASYGKKHYFYKPSDKLGTMFIVSPINFEK